MGETSYCALRKLGAKGILRFARGQHSKNRSSEESTGPLSSQNHSVRLGMMELFRVARRGGDAELRAVLGLPVIPNAPGA
jgi:hypothetical protein